MTEYVLLNWIFCISTSLSLIILFLRYRFLLLKPSIVVITFFHLQIQWAATIQAGYIESYLIQPFYFFILVQIFPLIGLMGSFFILHKQTIVIYSRIANRRFSSFSLKKEIFLILIVIVAVISIFYLWNVPPQKTGLYAILLNPTMAAEAREASLKLLENPMMRYGYSFLKNVFAPLLSVLIIFFIIKNIKIRITQSFLSFFTLIFIFVVVSLTGARYPAAALVLTVLWAIYLNRGMRFRPSYFFLALLLTFAVPVILTILREGQAITFSNYLEYFKGGIFHRVFVIPMKVGMYHVYHAQAQGFFGIAAVPKLAMLWGIQPINVSNFIYLNYFRYSYTLPSGLANTSYIFSYYSYFGILSVFFCLIALWGLDLSILVFKRIKNDWLLLASVSSLFTASFAFVATDYTIALLTNGFLIILFTSWLLDKINNAITKTHEERKFI